MLWKWRVSGVRFWGRSWARRSVLHASLLLGGRPPPFLRWSKNNFYLQTNPLFSEPQHSTEDFTFPFRVLRVLLKARYKGRDQEIAVHYWVCGSISALEPISCPNSGMKNGNGSIFCTLVDLTLINKMTVRYLENTVYFWRGREKSTCEYE